MEKRDAAKLLIRKLIFSNRGVIKESIKESLEAELLPAFNEVRSAFDAQVQGNLDTSLLLDEVVDEVLDELLTVEVDEGEIAVIQGDTSEPPALESPAIAVEEPELKLVPPPPDALQMPDRTGKAPFLWNAGKWVTHEQYIEEMRETARVLGHTDEPGAEVDAEKLTSLFLALAAFYESEQGDAGMAMESLMDAFGYSEGSQELFDALEAFVTDEMRAFALAAQLEELLSECDDPVMMGRLLVFLGKLKLQHLGDMEGAREAFDKAVMLDPENAEAQGLLDAVTV